MKKRLFIMIPIAILSMLIISILSVKSYENKQNEKQKITFEGEDYVNFDQNKAANYFDSKLNGNVKVKGKTKPHSKVEFEDYSSHNSEYSDKTSADKNGKFAFHFHLKKDEKKLSGWITSKNGKYKKSSEVYIRNNAYKAPKQSSYSKSSSTSPSSSNSTSSKESNNYDNLVSFESKLNSAIRKSKGSLKDIKYSSNENGDKLVGITYVVENSIQYAPTSDIQKLADSTFENTKILLDNHNMTMPLITIQTENGTTISTTNGDRTSMVLTN